MKNRLVEPMRYFTFYIISNLPGGWHQQSLRLFCPSGEGVDPQSNVKKDLELSEKKHFLGVYVGTLGLFPYKPGHQVADVVPPRFFIILSTSAEESTSSLCCCNCVSEQSRL